MSFDALVRNLSELDGLLKSLDTNQPAIAPDDEEDKDDALIKQAAADSGVPLPSGDAPAAPALADPGLPAEPAAQEGAGDPADNLPLPGEDDLGDGDLDGDLDPDLDEDDELFGKSFAVRTADGQLVRAVDGAQAVRSLRKQMNEGNAVMAKSLQAMTSLLKSQAAEIKSLRTDLARLGMAPRPRKAALTIHDKPQAGAQLQKSQGAELSYSEFMAKALDAQRAGRITGLDVSIAEGFFNAGQRPPADLERKVLGC